MTKTVYTFDPGSRELLGPLTLDASDLSPLEDGVYLIPANALEDEPPTAGEGQRVVERDGAWVVEPIPVAPPPSPPPPPPPPTAEQVLAQRDALLATATLRLAPLQDAVDIDVATAEETAALKAWKHYRVALSRIEAAEGFPEAVKWPKAPR